MTSDRRTAAGPTVVGQPAAVRLLQQVRQQARVSVAASSGQVITVLRALADHTHMEAALQWRPDEREGDPAFSVATWMHAVADQIERVRWAAEAGLAQPPERTSFPEAAEFLRRVADARAEYTGEEVEAEFRVLRTAVQVLEGDTNVLCGVLPSWRWSEFGVGEGGDDDG